jgi:hypothetical protein
MGTLVFTRYFSTRNASLLLCNQELCSLTHNNIADMSRKSFMVFTMSSPVCLHSCNHPRTKKKKNMHRPVQVYRRSEDMKNDIHEVSPSRMPSYGMWSCVDLVWTDLWEKCIASIFRLEKSAKFCRQLLTLVPRSRIFPLWRWTRYVPPKGRCTQDLHSATSQKTAFFIVTAVKTSDVTNIPLF